LRLTDVALGLFFVGYTGGLGHTRLRDDTGHASCSPDRSRGGGYGYNPEDDDDDYDDYDF